MVNCSRFGYETFVICSNLFKRYSFFLEDAVQIYEGLKFWFHPVVFWCSVK